MAQLTTCIGGNCPGVYTEPQSCGTLRGRDNAINVLIGGNLTIQQGAESEGKNVVLGDLIHAEAANETFNIGYVGVGACVTPDANEDYLVVGGNIISAATRRLIIGSSTTTGGQDISGNLRIKGSISPNNSVIDIVGSIIADPTLDLTPFQQLIQQTATTSTCLSSHSSSAGLTVTLTNTFTGLTITNPTGPDGLSQTYYVNINGNSFPNSAIPVIISGFDSTDVLIINVSGSSPTLSISYFQRDSQVGDAYWNTFRQHILWNFYQATSLTFSSPTTNWEGSVIAPVATDVSINMAALNGRFVTSGNVQINNTGFEFHNYPWEGGAATSSTCTACSLSLSATATACNPIDNQYTVSGSVSLTSVVSGTLTIRSETSTTSVVVTPATSSVSYSFTGLTSDGASHLITVSLPGCSTVSTTYTAPASCSLTPGEPKLILEKRVDKSIAKVGDVLTYTVVLTNAGPVSATNVIVMDSISTGLTLIANSSTVPATTTFTQGTPVSLWHVATISPSQSLTLTFQARADSTGILYNRAVIPGDTVTVCTSIPTLMCPGEVYTLTAPAGRPSYHWFKDGVLISGQTSNVLVIDQPGTYSLEASILNGTCPAFSCCPFMLELDSLPTFQANVLAATCQGNVSQNNGQLVLSQFNPVHTYQYSLGDTFNAQASLSGVAQTIPANGLIATTLVNPGVATAYTIRVYNRSGCYTDRTVIMLPTVCGCPASICVSIAIKQTKGPRRIGDPIH